MNSSGLKRLKEYIEHCHECFVSNYGDVPFLRIHEVNAFERKVAQLEGRDAEIVKNIVDGHIISHQNYVDKEIFDYVLYFQHFIRQREHFYMEEQVQYRRAVVDDGDLVDDYLMTDEGDEVTTQGGSRQLPKVQEEPGETRKYKYDRLAVVQYAERWWNDSNPAYKKFENNCTNYISQCVHAGGVPMTGFGNRTTGWWFKNNNWSYSWSVAHAFRWYLSGAKTGISAREVSSPQELLRGDVICYDFDGDGRWQHTTVVVGKDDNNMPLVNAQTTNSRMRYWAYEDSTAWTPNIQYKFFHLTNGS
ncbi:amidase domain-containing protein [Alteribacter populi]|uniref:amidase domain-containing protein n=1 Tax=Alteribacter populi TaxID=2011011 RepID=UPI000BBB42B5|nr:amidase domain-containing protein [Alteribacter populi]